MRKKTGASWTEQKQGGNRPASFDKTFPTLARWISQEEGWVELGADHYSRSVVRALYGGGMIWEGKDDYGSLDEALRAMEEGIAAWLEKYRPSARQNIGTALESSESEIQSDRSVSQGNHGIGKRVAIQSRSATPDRSSPLRRKLPKATTTPQVVDGTKGDAASSVPRLIVDKIRKLEEIAEALGQGGNFSITRLTILKGLCENPVAAAAFALFLVGRVRKKFIEKQTHERYRELVNRADKEMRRFLDHPSGERKESLLTLLREMEHEQNEHESIPWGMIRIIKSMELLIAEKCLRAVLRSDEAPQWLYRAARDYCERYDPSYGTGLIPASSPMLREIADFWRAFHGIGR